MNLFKQFLSLIPNAPLLVGTVVEVSNGVAMIVEPGGGRLQARGDAAIGSKVFFRDGVIESTAPDLPEVEIPI